MTTSEIEDKITDPDKVRQEIAKQVREYEEREKAKRLQEELAKDFKSATTSQAAAKEARYPDSCKCGKPNSVNASQGGYFCSECVRKMSWNCILQVHGEV